LPACSVVSPPRLKTILLATQPSSEAVIVPGSACVGSDIADDHPQQFIGPSPEPVKSKGQRRLKREVNLLAVAVTAEGKNGLPLVPKTSSVAGAISLPPLRSMVSRFLPGLSYFDCLHPFQPSGVFP
jgi:hypothetical protein